MIRDLSETLKAMLDDENLPEPLRSAAIAFERPTDPYSPGQRTVNVFLYDIRENVELRSNEPRLERQNGQTIMHRPPLRVACSYLVTAWPVGGEELPLQEHELLSQVLQVLSGYPTIPEEFLQGRLKTQDLPLPMVTALVDPQKNMSEFWTAIGNKLRPSLTVTVTIAMEVLEPEKVPMVITGKMRFGERLSPDEEKLKPDTQEEFFRIGGQILDAENKAADGASVLLVERGLTTTTDADGRYSLSPILKGTYTLRVQKGAAVKEVSITVPALRDSNYNLQLA